MKSTKKPFGPIDEDFIRKGATRVTDDDFKKVGDRAGDITRTFGRGGPLGRFLDDARVLLAMAADYYSGNYRKIPYWAVAAIVFALLYVLNPFDIVPDVIPVLGYIDDAAVVGLCLAMVEQQLHEYREWRARADSRQH